eukprot:CAMPEP_0118651472 /NCGR_PEP_ID=MMETSP0785-20121206/10804_1 /TAXON_ID=91992 /ORGANISM="Bolidomonas pacifica, Strain CCMP 1866" /LENGTH=37 /DNA_ID= /DNA_START= /DNA_END= /DNA_ORIENTATION=
MAAPCAKVGDVAVVGEGGQVEEVAEEEAQEGTGEDYG